eukprot:g3327.t1
MGDIAELRALIGKELESEGIYEKIRGLVSTFVAEKKMNRSGEIDEDECHSAVLDPLYDAGIIDKVIKSLEKPEELTSISKDTESRIGLAPASYFFAEPFTSPPYGTLVPQSVDKANKDTSTFLHLQLLRGSAFIDYMKEEREDDDGNSFLVVHMHYRNQRFRSRPVPIAVEPSFDETFLVELESRSFKAALDMTGLLRYDDPIHIALVRVDTSSHSSSQRVHLLSTRLIEWRHALTRVGGVTIPVELFGVGEENEASVKAPIGLLHVRCALLPKPPRNAVLAPATVDRALTLQRNVEVAAQRDFYRYARIWWDDFLQIDSSFKRRSVQIFAENEWGEHRPVTSFITPMSGGRLLECPLDAARFVSLIPYRRRLCRVGSSSGGAPWPSLHSVLSVRSADVAGHALLLCSLLLGFKLDAYVCIGSAAPLQRGERKGKNKNDDINEESHIWVMTRDDKGDVVFWESLTAQRYRHRAHSTHKNVESKRHGFTRIGCVFNHRSFYANVNIEDAVSLCDLNILNRRKWKPMDSKRIESLPRIARPVPLCPAQMDEMKISANIEETLRTEVEKYRNERSLLTHWNSQLGYLLAPALVAYEQERVSGEGQNAANRLFQQSIKRAVPEGAFFRAFPLMVNHRNAEKIWEALLENKAALKIIETRGDEVNLAVRVRVQIYPEGLCSCWIMISSTYFAAP